MVDVSDVRSQFEMARRQERSAANEMAGLKRQFENQQSQLDSLIKHKDECIYSLKNSKEAGLSVVQMREYKLLLDHVRLSVEQQQIKVDISQENFEKSKTLWQKKHEHYEKLNTALEQMEAERKQAAEEKFAEIRRQAEARKLAVEEASMKAGKAKVAEKEFNPNLIGKRL